MFAGSTDGKVHCWNTETGAKVCSIASDHTGPVQCIQFNPKYMMMASACTHMVCKLKNCLFHIYPSLSIRNWVVATHQS